MIDQPQPKKSSEELLYERMYISNQDLGLASAYAQHLLKKKWHFVYWESRRRWSTHVQQAAFTTALVVSYARPFTRSRGWPQFPQSLLPYNQEQHELHQELLALRHQLYAHSDSEVHEVRAMRIMDSPSAIVRAHPLSLAKEKLEATNTMIRLVRGAIAAELERLLQIIE